MERLAWLVLVFLTWGTATFLLKYTGMRIDQASGTLAVVIGYVVAGLTLSIGGGGQLGTGWAYVSAFCAGACYIIGNWAFIRLGRLEDVTTLAPLTSLAVLIPILLGFLVLGEEITVRKVLGIIFALVATILLVGS